MYWQTCAFIALKEQRRNLKKCKLFKVEKLRYLPHFWSDECFKGSDECFKGSDECFKGSDECCKWGFLKQLTLFYEWKTF